MAPIKILNGTQAVLLDYEKSIPSDHLPYSFTITRKDQFPVPEYEYLAPFVGVIIKFKRNDLGVLAGVFYMPTAIFSALSWISFFIKPEQVCIIAMGVFKEF